jgi:hypothetical protein
MGARKKGKKMAKGKTVKKVAKTITTSALQALPPAMLIKALKAMGKKLPKKKRQDQLKPGGRKPSRKVVPGGPARPPKTGPIPGGPARIERVPIVKPMKKKKR